MSQKPWTEFNEWFAAWSKETDDMPRISADRWERFKNSEEWKEISEALEDRMNQAMIQLRRCNDQQLPLIQLEADIVESFMGLPDLMIETLDAEADLRPEKGEEETKGDNEHGTE